MWQQFRDMFETGHSARIPLKLFQAEEQDSLRVWKAGMKNYGQLLLTVAKQGTKLFLTREQTFRHTRAGGVSWVSSVLTKANREVVSHSA